MLKAGGTVEEYEAKADSVKASLRQALQCFLPSCVLTVTVKAGSVILTVVARTDTSGGASQVESAARALQAQALGAMSSVLGVTIEETPATPSAIDVQVQVTRLAPSPPPPSQPFQSPPPPSPPTPPSSSPTAASEDKANSQGPQSVPLWLLLVVLLLVVLLLVVLLVIGYRRRSRFSRNEANLLISRDRANLDLQMISHQVQAGVQKGTDTQSDDSASLPDSLLAKRSISLAKASTASLPPGPPSSSTGQSVAELEVIRFAAAESDVAPAVDIP